MGSTPFAPKQEQLIIWNRALPSNLATEMDLYGDLALNPAELVFN